MFRRQISVENIAQWRSLKIAKSTTERILILAVYGCCQFGVSLSICSSRIRLNIRIGNNNGILEISDHSILTEVPKKETEKRRW
jgi:hypothetical protein